MSRIPKYAQVDPENPVRWQTCMRCGFIWNANNIRFQFQYQGTALPQDTRLMVCSKCEDALQPQLSPPIIPPDPPPTFNAFPENYSIDEDSFIATQSGDAMSLNGDQIVTQDDEPIVTDIPNPANSPDTP